MRQLGEHPQLHRLPAHAERPEMTAWLAITVAAVASRTIGSCAQAGRSRKNGFTTAAGDRMTRAPRASARDPPPGGRPVRTSA